MATVVKVLRRWWPIPALLLLSILVQRAFFESRYDVSGHAAGHLASSTAIFLGVPVVLILLWLLPKDRLWPLVVLACMLWLAALVGVLVGNVRVIDSIGSADWSDAEASVLGGARPGFESGHDLAEISSFLAVGAALLLVAVGWRVGRVSARVAIVCAVLCVLIPPWIFPGFGVVVLTVVVVWRRHRSERRQGLGPQLSR